MQLCFVRFAVHIREVLLFQLWKKPQTTWEATGCLGLGVLQNDRVPQTTSRMISDEPGILQTGQRPYVYQCRHLTHHSLLHLLLLIMPGPPVLHQNEIEPTAWMTAAVLRLPKQYYICMLPYVRTVRHFRSLTDFAFSFFFIVVLGMSREFQSMQLSQCTTDFLVYGKIKMLRYRYRYRTVPSCY